MADLLNIAGFLIGVVGLGIALYQGFERKRLQGFVRAEAWTMYEKANNLTGIVQAATRSYRAVHVAGVDAEVLSLMSKSEAFGIELLRESARQIHFSEPRFDLFALDHWVSIGRIDPDHLGIFRTYAVEDVPKPKAEGSHVTK
jgi:hypothetical protein